MPCSGAAPSSALVGRLQPTRGAKSRFVFRSLCSPHGKLLVQVGRPVWRSCLASGHRRCRSNKSFKPNATSGVGLIPALGAMTTIPVVDPKTIAEWSHRCASIRQSSRRFLLASLVLLALLAMPPILGWVSPYPYLLLAGFGALFVLAARAQFSRLTLQCPNCGNPPVAAWKQTPLWQIDHCSMCNHWLQDPRCGNGT